MCIRDSLYVAPAAVIRLLQYYAAAHLVVDAGKYTSTSRQSSVVCFTGYQYVTGYYIRWLSLPSTVSAGLAQPTFDRSVCRLPTSLFGHIFTLPNVTIRWFLRPELSLADGVYTLQLQSETNFRHGCALPSLIVDSSEMGLKVKIQLFLQAYTSCVELSFQECIYLFTVNCYMREFWKLVPCASPMCVFNV